MNKFVPIFFVDYNDDENIFLRHCKTRLQPSLTQGINGGFDVNILC